MLRSEEKSPETTSCRWRHAEKCGALLLPRCPAMEPQVPSCDRASEAVERSDSSAETTTSSPPPSSTEEPARELTCADFDVNELLAEFGW